MIEAVSSKHLSDQGCADLYKGFIALLILVGLTGCASSHQRFPDYKDTVHEDQTIPVLIDVLVSRDIKGSKKGFNEQVNAQRMEFATEELTTILEFKGYQVQILGRLNGLMYDWLENDNWAVSQDWATQGDVYSGPSLRNEADTWMTADNRSFFLSLFDVASKINNSKGENQAKVEGELFDLKATSDRQFFSVSGHRFATPLLNGTQSDEILFVRITGREQKLGKFLGNALLVGGVSGALTGGALVMVPSGTHFIVELAILDVRDMQIKWHNRAIAEGRNGIKYALKTALRALPYSDGDSFQDKKRKKLRELQKNY